MLSPSSVNSGWTETSPFFRPARDFGCFRLIGGASWVCFAFRASSHPGAARPCGRFALVTGELPTWNDGPAKEAILDFVRRARAVPAAAAEDGWTVVSVKDDWATVFR